jgi:hypothetical protein
MDADKQDKISQVHPYLQANLAVTMDAVNGTFKFRVGEEVRHTKGGIYIITGLPSEYVLEHSREPAYAYMMADGRICVRSQAEMEDGRFESVPEGTARAYVAEKEATEEPMATAPFEGMDREWTEPEKAGLNDVLSQYGWK